MASDNKNTIRFTIKTITEGGEEVQALGVNIDDLAKAITATQKKADKGIQISAQAIGLDAITNMIGKLNSVIQDLSGAYKVQEEAETKLAVAMRNTMGATDGEIQSIKELCSAQQALGVIGDEVQLQGAERLSTYLQTSEALKQLIPLMNDLTVKQYGMDASGENAAASAAILGKAMQGNVSAFKKMGIEFTDAQKTILEYGTEVEKAALLIEVVGAKVGGMNAELAKTDSGKMKKMTNAIGDIKESIGNVVIAFAPWINALSQTGTAVLGLSGLIKSFNILLPVSSKVMDKASASAKKLGISLRSLGIATGVGAAIAVLTWAISALCRSSDEASDSMESLSNAEEAGKAAAASATKEIREQREKLSDLITANKETASAVSELNSRYGEIFGTYSTAAEWLDTLTTKEREYAKMVKYRAQQQALNDTVVEADMDIEQLKQRVKEVKKQIKDIGDGNAPRKGLAALSKEYKELNDKIIAKTKERKAAEQKIIELEGFRKTAEDNVNAGSGEVTFDISTASLDELTERQKNVKKELSALADNIDNQPKIKQLSEEYAKLGKRIEEVTKARGLGSSTSSGKTNTIDDKEAKEAAERLKAKEKADEEILKLNSKNKDEYISQMEEGNEKELELINKAYYDKIEEIGKKEEELTELRIKEGKEGLTESEKELFDFARELAEKAKKKAIEGLTPLGVEGIKTFDDLSKALSYWNDKFNKASAEERAQIRQTISALEDLKSSFELDSDLFNRQKDLDKLKGLDSKQYKIEIESTGMDGWISKMQEMQRIMADTTATDAQKQAAAELAAEYRKLAAESVNSMDMISAGWGNIKGIGNSIQSLTEALNGQKNAWEAITSVIDSALSIYQAAMQVMQMVNELTQIFTFTKQAETVATKTATQAKVEGAAEEVAASGAVIAANSAETTSEVAKASAETFSAHASIPWVGIAIAGGMVAAMLATMLSLPKFASGGIVSGPTLGLIGEYAGASGNPEVVAPLDKLQSMIGEPRGAVVAGNVVFEIDGRKLVGVLSNTTRISSKSGKRTNIKI